MKEIPLTQGKVATVDDEDFDWLSRFRWRAGMTGRKWYAFTEIKGPDGKRIPSCYMHRMIMRPIAGCQVDHKDGDGLNNTRANMRVCSPAQNSRNAKRYKSNSSGFKGVHLSQGKWIASLQFDGLSFSIAGFSSAVDAAEAYDMMAAALFDEFARLNFPDRIIDMSEANGLLAVAKLHQKKKRVYLECTCGYKTRRIIEKIPPCPTCGGDLKQMWGKPIELLRAA